MMDLTRLKLEVYDLLAVLVPGLLVVCEVWVLVRGWSAFATSIMTITAPVLSVLLLTAFMAGHGVQEFGDWLVKRLCGPRFFKFARDAFWKTPAAEVIRRELAKEIGSEPDVDAAFDICLTRIKGLFEKRDLFLATSDLARSGFVLATIAVAPTVRISVHSAATMSRQIALTACTVLCAGAIATLFWKRMVRFRELSERPVFNTYLGTLSKPSLARAKEA